MRYEGTFAARHKDNFVVIQTASGSGTVKIGEGDDPDIFFADNAVNIQCEVSDVWEHLVQYSCTINLLVKHDCPQFYAADYRNVRVTIATGNDVIFSGYVQPLSLQQGYTEVYDRLTLNCVDYISAAQNRNYMGLTASTYDAYRKTASTKTLMQIIEDCIPDVRIYYDGSMAESDLTSKSTTLFSDLSMDEQVFLGETYSDIMDCRTVLENIMMYLNLRMFQLGNKVFILSYDGIQSGASHTCYEVSSSGSGSVQRNVTVHTLAAADLYGDCSISREDTINQVRVTCEQTGVDTVIENPCSSDDLVSRYPKPVKFVDDYVVWVDDSDDNEADFFSETIVYGNLSGESGDKRAKEINTFYMQIMEHPQWSCKAPLLHNGDQPQLDLNAIKGSGACFLNVGSSIKELDPHIVIPTTLTNAVTYLSKQSVGLLNPSDEYTTNYLIIKGKCILTPKYAQQVTMWEHLHYPSVSGTGSIPQPTYEDIGRLNRVQALPYARAYLAKKKLPDYLPDDRDVCSRYKGGKNKLALYCPRYYNTVNGVTSDAEGDVQLYMPPTDSTRRMYEFNAINTATPAIPLLKCRLTVGDKALSQTLSDSHAYYSWSTDKTSTFYICVGKRPESTDTEYPHVIGEWLDIMNDVTDAMMIDGEGMLIPVQKTDGLSGQVKFEILGIENVYWTQASGKTYGAITSSGTKTNDYAEAVWIKDFEIKVVSDNGDVNNTADKDLIYQSAENETFQNVRDVSFAISTALTTAERQSYGINDVIVLNNPIKSNGMRITTLYNRIKSEWGKPEQHFIDAAYRMHHEPKMQVEIEVEDTSGITQYSRVYVPGLDKTFFVYSIDHNLSSGTMMLRMRELNN